MRVYLIILFVVFNFLESSAQGNITSVQEKLPFKMQRENVFVDVPDSLMRKDQSGFSVVYVVLDDKGSLNDFGIQKLVLKEKSGAVILDYFNKGLMASDSSDYPLEVSKFYNLLKQYCNGLEFIRDESVEVNEVNRFSFITRFNYGGDR